MLLLIAGALRTYHASCFRGLESEVAREVEVLGATEVTTSSRGVQFRGDERIGFRVALWTRTANRVSELLCEAPVETREDLYRLGRQVDWRHMLHVDDTLLVETKLGQNVPKDLSHSHFCSLTVKNAIVDAFRERLGARPSVSKDPELPLTLYLHRGKAKLYRSLSAGSLHKRGYRDAMHAGALKETLAAGLVPDQAFVDPMCGSATLTIEAALKARNVAPGLLRLGHFGDAERSRFAFEHWLDSDLDAWGDEVQRAREAIRPTHKFYASDLNIDLAKKDARRAGVLDDIVLERRDVKDARPHALVVSNPPWGKRIGRAAEAWHDLGDYLRRCPDTAQAYLLCGDVSIAKHLDLKPQHRTDLHVSGVDLAFFHYDLGAQFTVRALQAKLRDRGLSTSGKKDVLIRRLRDNA